MQAEDFGELPNRDTGAMQIGSHAVCLPVVQGLLAACCLALLAACHATPVVEENAVPRPEEYKDAIQDYVRNERTDPTGIRDAFISAPALRPVGRDVTRYVICFRYTAKSNSDAGRYDAPEEVAAVFYDRRISQFVAPTPELCGQAAYQPFPELQQLCRERICRR